MFEFFQDIGNYDQRVVGRDDYDWGFISTARVSDGARPYETAVKHEQYNDGKMVIVEAYDSPEAAMNGHARWQATMLSDELPSYLTDCNNSGVQSLLTALGDEPSYPRVQP